MHHPLAAAAPFSFAQTLAFIRRFPPCQGDYLVTDDALTFAVALGGRVHPVTIRQDAIELPAGRDAATRERLIARARHLVGADDDLTAFYAAARGDQAFAPILGLLHGLHHVRFLTLEEIAVYCVFMQRTPITQAAALKRRFLAAFGKPVRAGDHELRAMPEMHELGALTAGEIAQAIGHARKAELVVSVVRGVAALGEELLATAPYAAARDALLAITGVGPFSAGAILLRGLGRMDELPGLEMIAGDAARSVYGPRFDPDAIVARYGRTIGYWSFYLKTGVARLTSSSRATPATRAHGRHTPGSRQARARHTKTPSPAPTGTARSL